MIRLKAFAGSTQALWDNKTEHAALRQLLTWTPNRKRWAYPKRLLHTRKDRRNEGYFLTGLLPHVLRTLDSDGLQFEVALSEQPELNADFVAYALDGGDEIGRFLAPPIDYKAQKRFGDKDAHPHQLWAIRRSVQARRGVVSVATAGGKSLIAAGQLIAIDLPSITIVPAIKIREQLVREFKDAGLRAGPLRGNKGRLPRAIVAVADSVTSVMKSSSPLKRELLMRPVLQWDECHHASASTWLDFAEKSRALYRFGLSATPFRNPAKPFQFYEDMVLRGVAGPLIVNVAASHLAKLGLVAQAHIVQFPLARMAHGESVRTNDWHALYHRGIVHNSLRNELGLRLAKALFLQDERVLMVVSRISHGELLLQELQAMGVPQPMFLAGGNKVSVCTARGVSRRKEPWEKTRADLEGREGGWVVVCSPVMDEGVDLPSVSAEVILAGGKSPVKSPQRVGRGMRIGANGRSHLLVFDFRDSFNKILLRHSVSRARWYRQHGFQTYTGLHSIQHLLKEPLAL